MSEAPSGRGLPRHSGKVWGPGAPGRRLPALRVTYTREIPGRLVFLAGALIFILAYMRVMRDTPGRSTAFADDAAVTSDTGSGAKPPSGHGAFQGLLDSAKDGEALEALDTSKPTDPYRTLMWNLKRYSVAEVSSIAVTVASRDLINDAPAWRGQPVRVVGQLIRAPELQRLGKNEAGYEYRWRGFIVDADDGNAIVFDLYDKPDHEFDRTDLVTVEGVFLQIVTYEARGGTKLVPFIEAKSIKPFVGDRTVSSFASSPTTLLLGAALLLAAIPFIGYLVSSWVSRRHEDDLVKALEKARQRRSANLAAASKKPADTAPAPTPTDPPAPSAPLAASDAPAPPSGPTGTVTSGPIAPDAPPTPPTI